MKANRWVILAYAYALKNAIEHKGKAREGSVLSALFQEGLNKKDIKEVVEIVKEQVEKVNKLKIEEQEKQFLNYKDIIKERKRRKGLPELPNVGKKFVVRLAPFPSGALHLGNARTYILNYLYAKKYKGKVLLVMDDTIGSKEKKVIKEAYKLIKEAFKWLDIKYEKPVIYKSDRLEIYYEYAEKLIKKGFAYVCSCSVEELRENRKRGIECGCRELPVEKQLERWRRMFLANAGEYVLRIKTNMQHPNPAFRDRVLFRISNEVHPRVGDKYRVWPMLEFSWAIDDHLLGITHIIRGKDLMMESEMERYIWKIFGWKEPEIIHMGMIRLEGIKAKLSKSKSQKEVESGKFIGWDDPRTWSIQSLRRRGFLPEAIIKFVEECGLTQNDIIVPVEKLYSINRKMIDKIAMRYSFVEKPLKLRIKNMPKIKEVYVKIHPEKEEKRKVRVGEIYISKKDYERYKGKEIRLMHLFNIKLGKKKDDVIEAKFTSLENKNLPRINWVSENIKVKVLMPNGKWKEGVAEESVKKLGIGKILQFERFGFVRLDKKNKEYEFWFTHN